MHPEGGTSTRLFKASLLGLGVRSPHSKADV